MKIEDRKNFIITIVYFALIAAIVYLVMKYALGLLMPFVIGFIVSLIVNPLINVTSKKLHMSKKAAAIVFVLLFYGTVGVFLFWLGLRIFITGRDFVIGLPALYKMSIEPTLYEFSENIEKYISGMDPRLVQTIRDSTLSLPSSLESTISNISSQAIRLISSVVSSVPSLFVSVILSIISSFFFAIDSDRIRAYFTKTLPVKGQEFIAEMKGFATNIGFKYVKAYATLMLITFLELAVGLSVLKVDRAIAVAALIAVIDILPILGTGGIVIPWVIFELIKGNLPFAIGLAILYIIILVVRNILEPKIIGAQIGLHPLVMLICMFVGVKIFGFIGLFALPVIVVVVKYLYDHGKIHFFSP